MHISEGSLVLFIPLYIYATAVVTNDMATYDFTSASFSFDNCTLERSGLLHSFCQRSFANKCSLNHFLSIKGKAVPPFTVLPLHFCPFTDWRLFSLRVAPAEEAVKEKENLVQQRYISGEQMFYYSAFAEKSAWQPCTATI